MIRTRALRFFARILPAAVLLATCGVPALADDAPVQVRMSFDEEPIVPLLAESLGYLHTAGIEIVPVRVEDFAAEDYLFQRPLVEGQIDAVYHWFNHAVFGARHGLPAQAVMVFNDAPGMTILVANRVRDEIRSAADFKGRNVAEGAGYGTKSLLTNYLARRAGLAAHSYTPVMTASSGREQAVLEGLAEGSVDVLTFHEPLTSVLMATGQVTSLYDLTSRESTTEVLGAAWPAQSLLMAPAFIGEHPDVAQRLVNALVRTMRFINKHTAEEIADQLPLSYFDGKDPADAITLIRNTLPTYAKNDYSFSPQSAELVLDTILGFDFDGSEEGQWRAGGEVPGITAEQLYDNRFVIEAMRAFP